VTTQGFLKSWMVVSKLFIPRYDPR
jgi:hypothetical protein